jgi:hypothetical protein
MHSKTLVHRTVNRSSDLQEYRDKDLWVSLVQARLNPMPCFPIGVDSFLPNALENTDQEKSAQEHESETEPQIQPPQSRYKNFSIFGKMRLTRFFRHDDDIHDA